MCLDVFGTMAATLVIKVADGNDEVEKETLGIYAEASNGQMPNLDLITFSNKRSLYNGYCTSSGVSLKYKKRKVCAVRHFPHGCGQNASFINVMPQDTEVVASLGDKENLVADEKMVKVAEGDCVKASEIGNDSSSHQLVESPVKLELPNILNDLLGKVVVAAGKFPPEWPISDDNVSKETNLKAKYFRRRVRAIREFPSSCGMHAICPTKEERLRIALGNKTLVAPVEAAVQGMLSRETVRAKEECSLVRKTARTGIEELDRDVQDRNAKKRNMKKKLLPSGKASYENKGAQVVKDKGDFSIYEQDEDSPAGQRPHDFQVILPPFGPDSSSHGNVHNKVRETQCLFQAICRKLFQGEEAKLKKQGYLSRRPDLKATQIIRAKGKEVNTGK
ncbi:Histone-lysine N-methyltransferase, H3 lysine-9 specific SUVH6 [Camellia lanceoleosa]|uniref:Histone-lysine N-methyltransferase, H3 lysine-9 specific SUVH6 n=1 Tax=Camellia lanceoleosa TaxID=1840588 RepID=A0ACC0HUZ9_9ERIC|nr:Histone-lysine N-methyltransferase, H3 lysine-9 specific SUVH6 [Camellia lanceoleosa]